MNIENNETIYQVFIDRFARSNNEQFEKDIDTKPEFAGGTIRGIINHFNHILELGVTTLWISPFCKTSAYHGYHTTDYFSIEPHFGVESDLKEFIDLVHSHGMKIITDFVPNHVSNQHPFFLEAETNVNSTYRDWFYFNSDNSYMCFLHYDVLPKLNLENPDARKYVVDAARHWLSFGIDGFRFDHVCGPSDNFWRELIGTLQQEFPGVILFGEAVLYGVELRDVFTLKMGNRWVAWLFGDDVTMSHYKGILPALLDFKYSNLLRNFARNILTEPSLKRKIELHKRLYKNLKLISFLDNHDMDRFMFVANNNKEKYKRSLELLSLENNPIVIYQGTEFGVTQDKAIKEYPSYGDLAVRKMVPWKESNNEIHIFTKKVLQERKVRQVAI